MWAKLDDRWNDDPRYIGLSDSAVALWLRCLVWASGAETDGVIPAAVARAFGKRSAAAELVASGAWSEHEGGFLTSWEHQPTKAQNDARRRYDVGRHNAKPTKSNTYDGFPVRNPSGVLAESAGTPKCPDPDPDPVPDQQPPPSLREGTPPSVEPAKARRAPRPPAPARTPPPTDRAFYRTPNAVAYCAAHGLDLDAEAERMVTRYAADGRTFVDWRAAFGNWLRNEVKWARERGGGNRPGIPDRSRADIQPMPEVLAKPVPTAAELAERARRIAVAEAERAESERLRAETAAHVAALEARRTAEAAKPPPFSPEETKARLRAILGGGNGHVDPLGTSSRPDHLAAVRRANGED